MISKEIRRAEREYMNMHPPINALVSALDALVDELDDCIFEPVGFDKTAIRQHIIDIMNERRRSVRNGYDYTSVRYCNIKLFYFEYAATIAGFH